jgi:two-component system, OmpR family, response regulator
MENLKILFVDDEPDFLETTLKRLSRRGYESKSALNWDEAFQVLARGWPDVVVLDVMLPGKDGIQCLREIKQQWPDLTVIMLTGHASVKAGLQGLEYGANDYCLKPIELDELIEKITIAHREASEQARKRKKLDPHA